MDNTVPLEFPSLQHLDWAVYNPSEALTLLLLLRPPDRTREFKTLSLYYDSVITTTELNAFLDTLLTTCSTQTLFSFLLDADGPILEESDGIPVLHSASSYLHPLFQFSHIEEFRIGGLPVQLDDAFVAAVATTWPRLRVLHLYTGIPMMSAITPAGLRPLARESRRLEDLGVSIGSWPCPILPPPHGHADMGRRDVPLSVHVHHPVIGGSRSREDGMQRAARLQSLWEIFPNAVDVEYYIS
ncbi:hypothetical protein EWM64_g8385 [Hericium alpestre]|uniref:Uncharacterized protein n=1 Tax=Hericium alpestre TaxID=135208 RepID=A0A4Y9ZQ60_9AGAM|nr:hypothetical protein EWM64_g8385 [Hericium alpestre]